jgi:TIR domain/Sel1 repeat
LTLANAADTVPAHTTTEGRWPSAVNVSTLFISYRRDDTAPYAGRLYDRLTAHFGAGQVFMDIDQIEPGEDFVEVIQRKVSACEIAIVLIGRHWLSSQDAEGRRRLDDPEDFVRLEVAASLDRKVRVVPVLVGGAAMPRMRDLPEAIATLARRNAIEISDARFHSDCDRLIESLSKNPSATAAPPDDTKGNATPAPGVQNRETQADPATARPAAGGKSASGKGWAIGAAATMGVAVLAFIGLRGTNSTPPAAPVTQAPPVLEAPSTKARGDTTRPSEPVAGTPQLTGPTGSLLGAFAGKPMNDQSVREAQQKEILELTERAKAGNTEAQFELGVIHETGTPKNLNEAAKWYSRAAQQRYALAKEGFEDVQTLLLRGTTAPDPQNRLDYEFIKRKIARMSARQEILSKRVNRLHEDAMEAIKRIKPG